MNRAPVGKKVLQYLAHAEGYMSFRLGVNTEHMKKAFIKPNER